LFRIGLALTWMVSALCAALPAAAEIVATVAVSTVRIELEDVHAGGSDYTGPTVSGALAAPLGDRFAVQIDARYARLKNDDGGEQDLAAATLHLHRRAPDWLVGAYLGAEYAGETYWVGGAEAQYNFSRASFHAAVGVGEGDQSGSAANLRARARFFVTDNVALEAAVDHTRIDDVDIGSIELGGEWKPSVDLPFSVFAGYRAHDSDDGGPIGDTNAIELGVRATWGARTLSERERRGPSLPRGPFVGRALD